MGATNTNTGQSTGALSATSITIGSFAVNGGDFIWLAVSQYSNPDRVPSAVLDPTGGNQSFVVHDATTIAEGSGTRRVTILKLAAPANVTANIVVSWPGAVDEAVVGADAWVGVDQTTPLGAAQKTSSGSSGATSTLPGIANAVGDVVHDSIAVDAVGSPALTASLTARWRTIAGANTTEGDAQSTAGTGSAIAPSWSNIFPGAIVAHIGAVIQQAAGGGAAAPVQPPLLPNPMRPTAKGIIGRVAMALRTLRPPVAMGLPPISATSSAALPLSGSAAATVLVQATSSAALPLSGAIAGQVLVQATSSAPLPLAGSGTTAVAVSAASSNALPLGGSAATTVLVQAQSARALPLGGSAAGTVLDTASSAQPLPLAGSATGAVLVQATSTQPLPLSGTITAGSGGIATSTQALPLGGTANATVLVQGISSAPLPLGGAAAAGVAIAIVSSRPLPLAGVVSATVGVQASAIGRLPLAGSITATVSSPFGGLLVDEPLYADFDDLRTWSEFDDLRTWSDFDDLRTWTVFTTPSGAEMLFTEIYEGETMPIPFVLRGANGPQDTTGATSMKWHVGNAAGMLITNKDLVTAGPATDGRVSYTPLAAEVAAGKAGKYDTLAIITLPGSPDPIVRKFPGSMTIKKALA